jgi:hypothetical protein
VTTDADIDFSSLPQVDQTARPPVQRRPRFDGDVSELATVPVWPCSPLPNNHHRESKLEVGFEVEGEPLRAF